MPGGQPAGRRGLPCSTMRLAIDIDSTPEGVFDLYVDPDRRAEWNPAARSVTLESGAIDEAGSRYAVETRYGTMVVDVLDVDRPHRYRLRETFGATVSETSIAFEPRAGAGCRVIADVRYEREGRFGRLLAPLAAAGGWWWGRRELRRLKAVAEGYSSRTVDR